jgi:phage gp36-like protein
MAYFDADGLIAFGGERAVLQLLDPDNTGTPDAGRIARLQLRVDAIINGYVGRNYSVAVVAAAVTAGTLPLVETIAVSIAMHWAYMGKPEFLVEGKTPMQGAHDWAMATLKQIGKGEIRLDVDEDPAPPANVGGQVYTGTSDDTPDGVGTGIFSGGWGDF